MKDTLFFRLKIQKPFTKKYDYHTQIDAVGFTLIDRTQQKCKCESTTLHIGEYYINLEYPQKCNCVICYAWNYEKQNLTYWYRPITIYDEED